MTPCFTAQRSILLAGTIAGILLAATSLCPATVGAGVTACSRARLRPRSAARFATDWPA